MKKTENIDNGHGGPGAERARGGKKLRPRYEKRNKKQKKTPEAKREKGRKRTKARPFVRGRMIYAPLTSSRTLSKLCTITTLFVSKPVLSAVRFQIKILNVINHILEFWNLFLGVSIVIDGAFWWDTFENCLK